MLWDEKAPADVTSLTVHEEQPPLEGVLCHRKNEQTSKEINPFTEGSNTHMCTSRSVPVLGNVAEGLALGNSSTHDGPSPLTGLQGQAGKVKFYMCAD